MQATLLSTVLRRLLMIVLSAVLSAVFLAGSAALGQAETPTRPTTPAAPEPVASEQAFEALYTLGSGDRLKVTVFGEADLSGEFQVDGSGNISFPLIGQVAAKGLSIRQMEQRFADKLKSGYLVDPRITVEVLNYRPFYILGEVNKPGKYEYVNGITLYNAVAMAGGYTYRARQNQAQVTRGTPETVIDGAEHAMIILPGDIINIRERFF